jgi:uncharacterized caspase-like protein
MRSRVRNRAVMLYILLCAAIPAQLSAADKRVALVIGNAAYAHASKLANPRNDAADVAAALGSIGFRVIARNDLDKAGLERALAEFVGQVAGAEVGLLYYRGHGVQAGGQNYLVPVDVRLATPAALDAETVHLGRAYAAMQGATVKLLFLDAGRDNPLGAASAGPPAKGSAAPLQLGGGTLISYSVQPGFVAHDGEGRNSPYAAALVKRIVVPGMDIAAVLAAVRRDVMTATGGRQVPWEHSSLQGPFYLTAGAAGK